MKRIYRYFWRFVPRKIGQQICLAVLVLTLLPLLVQGVMLIRLSRESLQASILDGHLEIASLATGEVHEHIESYRRALMTISPVLGILQKDLWRQETALVELVLQYPRFRRISLVNLEGSEIITSELGTVLKDFSGESFFESAKDKEFFLSEVQIAGDHVPLVRMMVPIKSMGKNVGFLTAEIDLRTVWDIVDNIRVGKQGRACLVDQSRKIIAHPDKKFVMKNFDNFFPNVLDQVLLGRRGTNIVKQDKETWFLAYSPVSGLGWGMIIIQPQSQAFFVIETMKRHAGIFVLLMIFGAAVMSIVFSFWISRPIQKVIQRSRMIARGDFDQMFTIYRRDELGKLLFAFNQMSGQLKKAKESQHLSMLGKAAAMIAHELKNSLMLIDSFVQCFPQRHKDPKFIKTFSEMIPFEMQACQHMLQNMMGYAHSQNFCFNVIELSSFLRKELPIFHNKIREHRASIKIRFCRKKIYVNADAFRLKQVLFNLVNNAIEAISAGGEIWITTWIDEAAQTGVFCVTDTGSGIKPEHVQHIFEPFFSTKRLGLGLGLSISRDIVQKHQGTVIVRSVPDKGTDIDVTLPLVRGDAEKKGRAFEYDV